MPFFFYRQHCALLASLCTARWPGCGVGGPRMAQATKRKHQASKASSNVHSIECVSHVIPHTDRNKLKHKNVRSKIMKETSACMAAHLSKKRKEGITEEKLCSRESTPSRAENLHRCQALAASDWPHKTACVPIGYLKTGWQLQA